MTEENNDIFVAGDEALVYLAEPMHKKYSAIFVWDHPLSTYIYYERFVNPLSSVPSILPVAYVLNGWPIS